MRQTPDMTLQVELPEEVVAELLEAGAFIEPVVVRGAAIEAATYALTALNIGASVVAVAQGPAQIREAFEAVQRWVGRRPSGCAIEIKGPSGKVTVAFEPDAPPDLQAAMASVGIPYE